MKSPNRLPIRLEAVIWLLNGLLTILLLLYVGRIAYLAYGLWNEIESMRTLLASGSGMSASGVQTLSTHLHTAREHAVALQQETELFASPLGGLGWLPWIGPDLAAVGPLLRAGADLTFAADETVQALSPLLDSNRAEAPLPALVRLSRANHDRLVRAQTALQRAIQARSKIPANVSGPLQAQLERLDRYLPQFDAGLTLVLAAPELLGADTPRTYLLLAQNEDELRATGGFITEAGTVTVQAGSIVDIELGDSNAVDNPDADSHPRAPGPLQAHTGTGLWLFRDANWSPDFPTSAQSAMELYALGRGQAQPVEGVIALDQAALRNLLSVLGPVEVPYAPVPVGADNLTAYMREAWSFQPGEEIPPEFWNHRKDFMPELAHLLAERLKAGAGAADPAGFANLLSQAIAEKHMLIYVAHPTVQSLLVEHGWAGAVRPGQQDFVFVVDSNVGFNKVNAVVERSLSYEADLSELAQPMARLQIGYAVPGEPETACRYDDSYGSGPYADLMQRCYWNYLRVLAPEGAQLVESAALPTPGNRRWNGQPNPGVFLQEAGESATTEFNQFFVVPRGERLETSLVYSLPASVVVREAGEYVYRLRWQKQAGVAAIPIRIRIMIPATAQVIAAEPAPTSIDSATLVFEGLTITTDLDVRVTFHVP